MRQKYAKITELYILWSELSRRKCMNVCMNKVNGNTFTLEVPVVIRLPCDCAVADDAVMPIRTESSS